MLVLTANIGTLNFSRSGKNICTSFISKFVRNYFISGGVFWLVISINLTLDFQCKLRRYWLKFEPFIKPFLALEFLYLYVSQIFQVRASITLNSYCGLIAKWMLWMKILIFVNGHWIVSIKVINLASNMSYKIYYLDLLWYVNELLFLSIIFNVISLYHLTHFHWKSSEKHEVLNSSKVNI